MVPEESTHAMASVGRMTFTIKKQVSYRSDCDGDGVYDDVLAVIQIQTLLPPQNYHLYSYPTLTIPLLPNPLTTTTPLLLPQTGTAQSMAKSNKRKQKIAPNALLV